MKTSSFKTHFPSASHLKVAANAYRQLPATVKNIHPKKSELKASVAIKMANDPVHWDVYWFASYE